jgi:hypothetical protein
MELIFLGQGGQLALPVPASAADSEPALSLDAQGSSIAKERAEVAKR